MGEDTAIIDRLTSQAPHGVLGSGCEVATSPTRQVMGPGPGGTATIRAPAGDIRRRRGAQTGVLDGTPASCRLLAIHDGAEVDIVIEDGRDGSVVGIEVKSGSRIHPKDRRGLRILRDALGDRFTAGVVLYSGPHSIRYKGADAGIIALPLDRLWTGAVFG